MLRNPARVKLSNALDAASRSAATCATADGAPFTTRSWRPSSKTIASAVLTDGSNGVKRTGTSFNGVCRAAAEARTAESIGS
jgi:Flp pilus assembly protein TadG